MKSGGDSVDGARPTAAQGEQFGRVSTQCPAAFQSSRTLGNVLELPQSTEDGLTDSGDEDGQIVCLRLGQWNPGPNPF